MTDEQYEEFFEPYAGNVEGFYEADYWKLSDALVQELFRRHLQVRPGQHILDAGGGTGRWGLWCAEALGVEVTVADKSSRMLETAASNVAAAGAGDKVHLVECDLEDAPQLPDAAYDGVISTYGVLSFLDNPAAAFETLHRVMKPGAHGLLMSHSLSNAVHSKINRDGADPAELRELMDTGIVKWAPHVPPLRVYSSQDLRDLGENAGLQVERVFGVTTLAQPGPEDFGYPYQTISAVSKRLQEEEYFQTLLDLELKASEHPEWADRGVNLMVHVRKAG
ncbi:class I SAM-dependent methyltransferase [Streptomyces sp. IBSBF 2435]|uniref:class I SAM-dependent methyltransferase n=1 Tax=Streptomyces sp. IBSBF 2435 TaxID=2903531 RepID=UPI002FDC38CB